MGLSYVKSVYATPSPSSTSSIVLSPTGTRGRLLSVWYVPDVAGTGEYSDIILRNLGSATTIFYDYLPKVLIDGTGSGNAPIEIPANGILFTDGLGAVSASAGMVSITVTYE